MVENQQWAAMLNQGTVAKPIPEEKKVFKIVGISGSLRAKSLNLAALKYAGHHLTPGRATFEIAYYADVPVYNGDVED